MTPVSEKESGLFVVGTDTEVGKTYLSAVLVGLLARGGKGAGYLKPVGSGAEATPDGPASPDALFVARRVPLSQPPQALCPVLAQAPLAPAEALAAEGRRLDWESLLAACQARLAGAVKAGEVVVVEGVGGLLVPLSEDRLAVDLVVELDLPIVVVARPSLGTINHTLLTLAELRRRGRPAAGFVFSGPGEEEMARANARWIEAFGRTPFRGWLGDVDGLDWPKALDAAGAGLDLSGLPGF